jgi:hypothetical protein
MEGSMLYKSQQRTCLWWAKKVNVLRRSVMEHSQKHIISLPVIFSCYLPVLIHR